MSHLFYSRQRVRTRPSLGQRNLLVSISSEANSTILRMAKVVAKFGTLLFRILLQSPTKKSIFFSLLASSFSILLFKRFLLFGPNFFSFQNTPTPLGLSRDKTKGQSYKNTYLNCTKTLPTK